MVERAAMTLRVYFDIIPFGEEDNAYPIHELSIHNIGDLPNGEDEYTFELNEMGIAEETVTHVRADGAIELVRKVLNTDWMRENAPDFRNQ